MIEAAETDLTRSSALGRRVTWFSRGVFCKKLIVPSMMISENLIFLARICLTARRVASLRLAERPYLSSSSADTQPVALASAYFSMRRANLVRFLAVSFLESVRLSQKNDNSGSVFSIGSASKMTAPTTSGPA